MLKALLILLIAIVCSAGPTLQLSVYGEAFNKPFENTAYLDCRLSTFKWDNIVTPYLALTKYTTLGEVGPLYGFGLAKNWTKDRFFIDLSSTVYNDKTFRFMVFTTFNIIQ